jgi:hypothetical protein
VECGFDFHNLEWVEWIAIVKEKPDWHKSIWLDRHHGRMAVAGAKSKGIMLLLHEA